MLIVVGWAVIWNPLESLCYEWWEPLGDMIRYNSIRRHVEIVLSSWNWQQDEPNDEIAHLIAVEEQLASVPYRNKNSSKNEMALENSFDDSDEEEFYDLGVSHLSCTSLPNWITAVPTPSEGSSLPFLLRKRFKSKSKVVQENAPLLKTERFVSFAGNLNVKAKPASETHESGEDSVEIEVVVEHLSELFKSDENSFYQREIDKEVSRYIADQRERSRPLRIFSLFPAPGIKVRVSVRTYVPAETDMEELRCEVQHSLRAHYKRKYLKQKNEISRDVRNGIFCLEIGLVLFVILLFLQTELVVRIDNPALELLGSMIGIGAWVVISRPCDLLLFSWWFPNYKRRLNKSLSKMEVSLRFLAPDVGDQGGSPLPLGTRIFSTHMGAEINL